MHVFIANSQFIDIHKYKFMFRFLFFFWLVITAFKPSRPSWLISARPRSAEYTVGICFETAKNTKTFECFFTGFQHSLWKFSTTGNLYSLKFWLWFAAIVCVVSWPISNALLNDIWLTCFTRMCNWNYWHKHRVLWLGWPASSNG